MYDTSTQEAELLRIYSRDDAFTPCEREKTRAWDDMKEADEESPAGKGRFFRVILASGMSVGNTPEGGDFPGHRPRRQVECNVQSSQITAGLSLSTKFLAASQDNGAYGGDQEHEGITETMRNLYTHADRLIGCGHGTGRLAIIDANAAATDTIVCAAPEMAFQLRENEYIDIVDTDTGGTPQYEGVQILAIDWQTGTLTLDQNVTVTAGWGLYHEDTYGNGMPNGFRNIDDDGDFASTIFGQTRATHNGLNATVMDGNGGLQDYTDDLLRSLLDQITFKQDLVPTQIRCNKGIAAAFLNKQTPDRVFMQTGKGVPDYTSGANQESLAFVYGDKKIPFVIDTNLPAREAYALHMPVFRKHTLVPADWMRVGNKILNLAPADGGGTYKFALVGAMLLDITISARRLNCHGKLSNVKDRIAGDS
jgi:hypothetical protein